jgi:hypothetical protein
MPNVKAGDLAITRSPNYSGLLVEVIAPAPRCAFTLPNGVHHEPPRRHPSWIVKLIGFKMPAPFTTGQTQLVDMGVAADEFLYPLPGEAAEESSIAAHAI